MKKVARVVANKQFRIVETNLPVRFFWTADGEFDGVEYVLPKKISRYQKELIKQTMGVINIMLDLHDELCKHEHPPTKIPNVYLKAFDEDDSQFA